MNSLNNGKQTQSRAKKALHGLKVVEYSQFISGPYCAKLLGDLGAEVVKIENPGVGDRARTMGPFINNEPHPERSGLFAYLNTNKLGITLDVKTPTGRKALQSLLEKADVFVENNPPRLMKKWGLAYEDLRKINPKLIVTSITAFGQTGPYRDYKGCDLITYHSSLSGNTTPRFAEPEQPPLKTGGRITEFYAGQNGALASMGAVLARRKTDRGQQIDISAQECFINNLWAAIPAYKFTNNSVTRKGGTGFAPMAILPVKDGYVSFQFSSEAQWKSLVKLMGNPEWAENELFKDQWARGENWDALKYLMMDWLSGQTKQSFFHAAQRARCPVGPVNTMEEIVNCEHLKAREFFVDIEISDSAKARGPSAPYKFSETPWCIDKPAPKLGQHNEDIYCGRLGYAKEDLVRMRGAGII